MAIYQPGEVVAERYRISQALSQGGMGAVYLAEQLSLGRQVALKVILAQHQDSDSLRRRFDHEARAVCQLHHPNIITYHDYGHDAQGRPFLVMEFLAGYPGSDLVYGPRIPTVEACVHVLGQLASALSEAHGRGIIHRDLKWSNAMIVPQTHDPLFTKLIDFGILKLATDGSSGDQRQELTRTGVLLGTPQYMSPEAICGRPIDGRADQYSLAVMAYELLTGRRPFETESRLELLRQHVQEPAPAMNDIGPERVPMPQLEAAVLRGMAKQPEDRFESVVAFHAALARAVGVPEPTAPSPVRRSTGRGAPAGDVRTPLARPGAGPTPIAGRTDPRGVPHRVHAGESALPPHRTPSAAPIDTAADTGSRPRQPGARAPRWLWIAGAVGLMAVGFAVTAIATTLGDDDPPPDTIAATHPIAPTSAGNISVQDKDPSYRTAADADRDAGATATNTAVAGTPPEVVPDTLGQAGAADTVIPSAAAPDAAPADTEPAAAADTRAPEARVAVPPPTVHRTTPVVRYGKLTISATPYAVVWIDGKKIGTTPIRDEKVRAGHVKVVLRHETYGAKTRSVTVHADQSARLTVDMKE